MARTMTDEQEREVRDYAEYEGLSSDPVPLDLFCALLHELDAERAAHKLTEAAAAAEAQRHDELLAEVRTLKERLKRAEAVCEFMEARDLRMNDALAAWRAGK